jgi:hypothetical protein
MLGIEKGVIRRKMKYICKGAYYGYNTPRCGNAPGCDVLSVPHEHNAFCDIGDDCKCVPMDLEYYMRKIIREHEESEDES